MPSDPTKPLLRLEPPRDGSRRPGRRRAVPGPRRDDPGAVAARVGPAFDRLRALLGQDPTGLALRQDPTALAPERLLVFEFTGALQNFVDAINRVPGLE